jgi:hypothetical protein
MAEQIGFKYDITVNAVNLASHVVMMKHTESQEIKDWLASNPSGTSAQRHRLPGVQDMQLDVTYKDDLAASGSGSVHFTNRGLMGNTGFVIVWCYNGVVGAPSATNPVYTMTAILADVPMGGNVNDVMDAQYKYQLASGAISVAVA